jgi:type II secretory pathway pseudopilin PulG
MEPFEVEGKRQQGFTVFELIVTIILLTIVLPKALSWTILAPGSIARQSAENYSKSIKDASGVDLKLASCLALDNDGNGKISCSFVLSGDTVQPSAQSSEILRECESSWRARLWGGSCSLPTSTFLHQ